MPNVAAFPLDAALPPRTPKEAPLNVLAVGGLLLVQDVTVALVVELAVSLADVGGNGILPIDDTSEYQKIQRIKLKLKLLKTNFNYVNVRY